MIIPNMGGFPVSLDALEMYMTRSPGLTILFQPFASEFRDLTRLAQNHLMILSPTQHLRPEDNPKVTPSTIPLVVSHPDEDSWVVLLSARVLHGFILPWMKGNIHNFREIDDFDSLFEF
jgi:hypothetical protein